GGLDAARPLDPDVRLQRPEVAVDSPRHVTCQPGLVELTYHLECPATLRAVRDRERLPGAAFGHRGEKVAAAGPRASPGPHWPSSVDRVHSCFPRSQHGKKYSMELRQLKHFLAVLEHGSMSKAAEALGISHQGLSKSLAGLEEAVQVQLLVRGPRGVTPSTYG